MSKIIGIIYRIIFIAGFSYFGYVFFVDMILHGFTVGDKIVGAMMVLIVLMMILVFLGAILSKK